MTIALPPWAEPGCSFKVVYGHLEDDVWHIRSIVDGMAVCRRWRRAKRRWHYEVLDGWYFEGRADRIALRPVSRRTLTQSKEKADA
jgi:hypothetical protein